MNAIIGGTLTLLVILSIYMIYSIIQDIRNMDRQMKGYDR